MTSRISSISNTSVNTIRNLINVQRNLKGGIILGLSCVFCIGCVTVLKKKDFLPYKEEGYVEVLHAFENIYFEANPKVVDYIWYKFKDDKSWSFKTPVYIKYITSDIRSVPNFKGNKVKIKGSETHEIVVNKIRGTIIQRGIIYK